MRQLNVLLCRPETLNRRHEATDIMDRLNTETGRKFAQKHIDDAVTNLLAGRAWNAKPGE